MSPCRAWRRRGAIPPSGRVGNRLREGAGLTPRYSARPGLTGQRLPLSPPAHPPSQSPSSSAWWTGPIPSSPIFSSCSGPTEPRLLLDHPPPALHMPFPLAGLPLSSQTEIPQPGFLSTLRVPAPIHPFPQTSLLKASWTAAHTQCVPVLIHPP